MRLLSGLLLILITFTLTACGKKGPLKLPAEPEQKQAQNQQAIADQQLPRLISFQDLK